MPTNNKNTDFINDEKTLHQIDSCNGCLICILRCPQKAISLLPNEEAIVIDRYKCINCNFCMEICPIEAIRFTNETKNNKRHVKYRIKLNMDRFNKFTVINAIALSEDGKYR